MSLDTYLYGRRWWVLFLEEDADLRDNTLSTSSDKLIRYYISVLNCSKGSDIMKIGNIPADESNCLMKGFLYSSPPYWTRID